VPSGQEALELLARERFDLVLMDISLPDMNGLEITRRIRAMSGSVGHIPIVAATAHVMRGDRENFLAAGMDDYLAKPLSLDELETVLARVAVQPV
jgi:CheY-like chemotaxis protein